MTQKQTLFCTQSVLSPLRVGDFLPVYGLLSYNIDVFHLRRGIDVKRDIRSDLTYVSTWLVACQNEINIYNIQE